MTQSRKQKINSLQPHDSTETFPEYISTRLGINECIGTCSRCGLTVGASTVRQLRAAFDDHTCAAWAEE